MLLLKRVLEGNCVVQPYVFRDHTGFAIFNENGENVAFSYDEEQQCCEDFEVEWIGVDEIDELYGMTFNSPCIEIEDEGYVTCRIISESKEIVCSVFNDHNGYYAHYVTVAENGTLVHELCV